MLPQQTQCSTAHCTNSGKMEYNTPINQTTVAKYRSSSQERAYIPGVEIVNVSKRSPGTWVLCFLVSLIGLIIYSVGFATDGWLYLPGARMGLWKDCLEEACNITFVDVTSPSWKSTKNMCMMGMVSYILTVLFTFLFALPLALGRSHFFPLVKLLALSSSVGTLLFITLGVFVFGSRYHGNKVATIGYSYGLVVLSEFFLVAHVVILLLFVQVAPRRPDKEDMP